MDREGVTDRPPARDSGEPGREKGRRSVAWFAAKAPPMAARVAPGERSSARTSVSRVGIAAAASALSTRKSYARAGGAWRGREEAVEAGEPPRTAARASAVRRPHTRAGSLPRMPAKPRKEAAQPRPAGTASPLSAGAAGVAPYKAAGSAASGDAHSSEGEAASAAAQAVHGVPVELGVPPTMAQVPFATAAKHVRTSGGSGADKPSARAKELCCGLP